MYDFSPYLANKFVWMLNKDWLIKVCHALCRMHTRMLCTRMATKGVGHMECRGGTYSLWTCV